MSDQSTEEWVVTGKVALASLFSVSVNTISAWLLRGLPYSGGEGRTKYVFDLKDVIAWLSLGNQSDGEEAAELSIERARLAKAQTDKVRIDTQLQQAKLGQVLAGGVIPADEVRKLFREAEVKIMQTIASMVSVVPPLFIDGKYRDDVDDPTHRLRLIMDEYRFQARNDFRTAGEHLLSRYLGEQPEAEADSADSV